MSKAGGIDKTKQYITSKYMLDITKDEDCRLCHIEKKTEVALRILSLSLHEKLVFKLSYLLISKSNIDVNGKISNGKISNKIIFKNV